MNKLFTSLVSILLLFGVQLTPVYAQSEFVSSGDLPINQLIIQQSISIGPIFKYVGIVLGIWIGAMLVIFLLGSILSKITLNSLEKKVSIESYRVTRFERFIQAAYKTLINIASIYYYLSIPILIVIIIGLLGGLGYIMLEATRFPIKLAVALLIGGLYTLYALVRSLFIRIDDGDPGIRISKDEEPGIWIIVTEVAKKLNTRPVDEIFIISGSEIAVYEKGSLLEKWKDQTKRRLILGLGSLDGMKSSHLMSILAHEYGHFINKDTAGGNTAHYVRLAMIATVRSLVKHGLNKKTNPAWLYLSLYFKIFMRITRGASRLQEYLADRHSAVAYGSALFEESLRNLVWQGLLFDAKVNQELMSSIAEKRSITDIYNLPEFKEIEKLREKYEEVLNINSSIYDTHPSPKERFVNLKGGNEREHKDNSDAVWTLFVNAEKYKNDFTNELRLRTEAFARRYAQ